MSRGLNLVRKEELDWLVSDSPGLEGIDAQESHTAKPSSIRGDEDVVVGCQLQEQHVKELLQLAQQLREELTIPAFDARIAEPSESEETHLAGPGTTPRGAWCWGRETQLPILRAEMSVDYSLLREHMSRLSFWSDLEGLRRELARYIRIRCKAFRSIETDCSESVGVAV